MASTPCHCGGIMFGDGYAHTPTCPAFEGDATPPAPPAEPHCEWLGCTAPALCQSGNFGNRLVCRDHFQITNGPPAVAGEGERLTVRVEAWGW